MRPRSKRKFLENPKSHQVTEGLDRISNLPVHVIRHILSCIPPKEVAKTSVLSRRWLCIWDSRPDIYLDEEDFDTDEEMERETPIRNAFLTYLENFLKRREKLCENNREVDKLVLSVTAEDSSSELLVKRWIDFASKNKLKKLHLELQICDNGRFDLGNIALFSTTLVELTITNSIVGSSSFTLPNLRSLFLSDVWIENDDFPDFIAGCPRIEELTIEDYQNEVYTIVVPSPVLKFLKVHCISCDYTVKVESTNLESLVLGYLCVDTCEVEITSPTTVKNLTLRRAQGREGRALMHFIHKFPRLEKLMIDGFLPNLYVSQPNLTSFVLKVCNDSVKYKYPMEEIRIDAPMLKSFEYTGGTTSFMGITAFRELEFANFQLNPLMLDGRWYICLRNILESFAHSKLLSLDCPNEKAVIFPGELRERLLPTINDLKNLKLRISPCAATSEEILDGFTWILPGLKTLSLTLGSISELIEFHEGE